VLDLGLPDLDGLELCRRLRGAADVPILILTARDEEADRIIGLELGADDYVTKPFSPRELVARVRAVLRRVDPAPTDPQLIEVGELRIDLRSRTVTVAEASVQLRTLEFELLAELARHAGQVVSRDRLLDRVWGLSFAGGTRTVDVHVAQLRKKLGRQLIQTVRGVGYRILESH
jgi:DNA-binding response OmpR family regulator